MRNRVVLVPGTWANTLDHDDWHKPDKSFARVLIERGYNPIPFDWDTNLDGIIGKNDEWLKAGHDLGRLLEAGDTVIAHSHGGQVIAYSLMHNNVWLNRVVTLATPVRSDIPYNQIKYHSQRWTHVYGNYQDYWQILGELFDGKIDGLRRKMPQADKNIKVNCNHQQTHSVDIWDKYSLWQLL